jgi:hypothetical protein
MKEMTHDENAKDAKEEWVECDGIHILKKIVNHHSNSRNTNAV